MKKGVFFLVALVAVFPMAYVGGCAHKPPETRNVLECRPSDIYDWYKNMKVPVDKKGQIQHFLGFATQGLKEEKTIMDAFANAADQVLVYVGTVGIFDYERANVELGHPLSEEEVGQLRKEGTILLAMNHLQQLKMKEIQLCRWVYTKDPETEHFDVGVHVGIPNDALGKLMRSALREQEKRQAEVGNRKAEQFLEDALKRLLRE